MHPKTQPNPKSKAGVLRLNRIVWGLMAVGFIYSVLNKNGSSRGIEGVMLLVIAGAIGAGANAVFSLWKLSQGNRYQAVMYFLAMVLLAAVTAWLWPLLNDMRKIGG
ncbi:hypothetical protein GCM10022409_19650 [Hymenobacter glaciei]|uniref:Uncharacterized protein n=1 Tax=Hymenobacter glaciei TaxID=877209 RepID=A0ABP7U2X8_9BACT